LDTADARIIQLEEGQLGVLQLVGTSKLRQFDRLKRWCDWLPETLNNGWRMADKFVEIHVLQPGPLAEFEAPSVSSLPLAFDSPSSLTISAEFAWFQNENVGERFCTSFLLPHAVPKTSKNAVV